MQLSSLCSIHTNPVIVVLCSQYPEFTETGTKGKKQVCSLSQSLLLKLATSGSAILKCLLPTREALGSV